MDWVKLEEQVRPLNKGQRLIIRDDVHDFPSFRDGWNWLPGKTKTGSP